MKIRALIVEDNTDYIEVLKDVLDSLGHSYAVASDLAAARKLLAEGGFDYVLLDLEFPVGPGRFPRKENGINLLAEVRSAPETAALPVLVVTGHGLNGPELGVNLMRDGATDFVGKNAEPGVLDKAIIRALNKAGKGDPAAADTATVLRPKAPFSAAPREVVIYEDRVTICGVEVWHEAGQPDLRQILLDLSQKKNGAYVHLRGPDLNEKLKRLPTNPVGRPIKNFRETARQRVRDRLNLDCGLDDIIQTDSGYHFAPWIVVQVVTGEDEDRAATPAPSTEASDREPNPESDPFCGLNDRQRWVLNQIGHGARLCQRDVIAQFRRDYSPSAIKRDLKALRDTGRIETHSQGHFVVPAATAQS